MNPQHILFPTDLSVPSLRPLERSPELFEDRDVTLLHIVPSVALPAPSAPFAPPIEDPSVPAALEDAREKLEELKKLLSSAKSVQVEAFSASDPGKETAQWAAKHDVDLMVLSTHGRTGVRRLMLGSVAESILRHSSVPVLVFPAKETQDRA